jgi:hypothetical protein
MAKTKDRVWHAADSARPYVDRAVHDDELREGLKRAFLAAREVYEDLAGPRGVTSVAQRLATDTDVQEGLRVAVEELRRAGARLQARERHRARNTFMLLVGITIGVLFNPWSGAETRRWLSNELFGESEFGYSDTADNSGTPPPAES